MSQTKKLNFGLCKSLAPEILSWPVRNIFSVVNICIELSLYAVAVRFLDYRFFLL